MELRAADRYRVKRLLPVVEGLSPESFVEKSEYVEEACRDRPWSPPVPSRSRPDSTGPAASTDLGPVYELPLVRADARPSRATMLPPHPSNPLRYVAVVFDTSRVVG